MRLLWLAAVLFVIPTFGYGQHGGSGGFSRGGFASGGFRGGYAPTPFRSNSIRPAAPRSGFRPAPPGFVGPALSSPRLSPYLVRGPRPVGAPSMSMAASSMYRAPYHSPNGGHLGHDGHFHNHVIIVNRFPFRRSPFVLGYPYIWPSNFDDSDNSENYDSQQTGNYAAPQPSDNGSGVDQPQPDDQDNPQANGQQAQPSSSSRRTPHQGAQAPSSPSGGLVFRDGPIQEYKWVTPKTADGSR